MSSALFRTAAVAALRNAEGLLADARLLQDADRDARCMSLSIIGQEEVGKALVYAVAAT
ncbi:MAG: AbiV family abortive infection protein [Chloroflexota bacterium]|nr:AbiV family abortive infection protein [Chloroflexota bacterium]